MKRLVFRLVGIFLSVTLLGQNVVNADQSVTLDLSNFQSDGLALYPNYSVYGISDGDRVTLTVQNSAEGFLGYINDGSGNSISLSSNDIVAQNNSGQFYGEGDVSSLVIDQSINGTYTVTVVFGSESKLSRFNYAEDGVAVYTSDPHNSAGLLFLDWRYNGGNEENWKTISFITRSGNNAGNMLVQETAPVLSQSGKTLICSTGKYTYLNGGSTSQLANLEAVQYVLYVNGSAVSNVTAGSIYSVPSVMLTNTSNSLKGTGDLSSVSWDISALSDFNAYCEVSVWQGNANIKTRSSEFLDNVKSAKLVAETQAWEDQRSTATTANFTKDMREMRKRIAARQP